jgi:ABC-type transport system involved in multi-copper enzyme maturation permease subunit
MNATIAAQMFAADLLKLRKKRSTMIWALILAFGPLLIVFVANALEPSSPDFIDLVRALCLLFGPLAAILIGVEAGTSDASAGVFRDLVVTGRSRLALFASRVPAAVAACWVVIVGAYALLVLGSFVLARGEPTPDAALILKGLGFALLANGMICAVAVGFASLTNSKPGAITALIAWHIVASPVIANIESLGSAREGVLSQAIAHFSPVRLGDGAHGATVTMSLGTAVAVLIVWLVVFLALGAWRTCTIDA